MSSDSSDPLALAARRRRAAINDVAQRRLRAMLQHAIGRAAQAGVNVEKIATTLREFADDLERQQEVGK